MKISNLVVQVTEKLMINNHLEIVPNLAPDKDSSLYQNRLTCTPIWPRVISLSFHYVALFYFLGLKCLIFGLVRSFQSFSFVIHCVGHHYIIFMHSNLSMSCHIFRFSDFSEVGLNIIINSSTEHVWCSKFQQQ